MTSDAETIADLKRQLHEAKRKLDELPWHHKDIMRGLILFRTSSNAHGFTNYQSLTGKVDALPQSARDELAAIMTNMAIGLSDDEVKQNGVIQQWISEGLKK